VPPLSESESKRLLAAFGVPVVADRLVADPEEAAAAADEFGGPVVVKLCGAAITHKTERGLVRLGVEGAGVRCEPGGVGRQRRRRGRSRLPRVLRR
jgi:acyl-CoA synthetase (NDP forming)